MAQELLGKPITARASDTSFTRADAQRGLAVRFVDGTERGLPITVAKVGGSDAPSKLPYAKVISVVKGGDAFNISSVNATTGDVTRGDTLTIVRDGIIAFTKRDLATGTAAATEAADIGKAIEGGTAVNGYVTTVATGGTGKVVDRDGTTLYVDLNA